MNKYQEDLDTIFNSNVIIYNTVKSRYIPTSTIVKCTKNLQELIDLRTPMNPLEQVKREFPNVKGYTMGICPSCGKKVTNISDWICIGKRQEPCGQILDWSV